MAVKGADIVANNIIKFGGGFLEHVNRVMEGVRETLDTTITANMSLTDHSPKDLADLDHPYAARHGSQGIPYP
jgi:hypothetical protein